MKTGTARATELEAPAGPLWSSPVAAGSSFPETVIIEGVREDGRFRPRSAYFPQPPTEAGVAPIAAFGEDLLAGAQPRPFGREERARLADAGAYEIRCEAGEDPAGVVFPLPWRMPAGADLRLVMEGDGPGGLEIALVRRGGDAARASDVVARGGSLPARLDLTADAESLELDLVVLCPPGPSLALLRGVHLDPRPAGGERSSGSWIWDARPWLGRGAELASAAQRSRLGRLYLQLPLDDAAMADGTVAALLSQLNDAGLAVDAVEGDPDMVTEAGRANALRRSRAVAAFMERHPGLVGGLQYDIEPYLRPDHVEGGWDRWARTIAALSQQAGLPLGIVVPFWMLGEEPARRALDGLDEAVGEVIVMAYRTDPAMVERMAAPWLAWGRQRQVPVRIALENGPIPAEYHRTYRRAGTGVVMLTSDGAARRVALWPEPVAAGAGRATYAFSHEVTVDPGRITFRGAPAALASARERLARSLSAWPSFAGLVIHELIPSGGEPSRGDAAKGEDG